MSQLGIESWIWYSLAIFITGCRYISRSLLFGSVWKLKIDDWIMLFAVATYTTLIITMNIVATENSNLLPPGFDISALTQDEVRRRQYGSKMVLVVEQMQILTIWTLKTTLLVMYYRLTEKLTENKAVTFLLGYIAVAFVVMEALYFAKWCRPFHDYWAVPTPNAQCSAATNHLITNAVFNISSDLIMLGIGLSLFIRSRLPAKRKVLLCCIFGLGIFVILAAILNKYYSFSHPFSVDWTFWYIREASTAMLVANMPFIWTLLRRMFHLGEFDPGEGGRQHVKYHSQRTARPSSHRHRHSDSHHTTSRGTVHDGRGAGTWRSGTGNGSKPHSHISSMDVQRPEEVAHLGHAYSPANRTSPGPSDRANKAMNPRSGPDWRGSGVYGRQDQELLELGPWDEEEFVTVPVEFQGSIMSELERAATRPDAGHSREGKGPAVQTEPRDLV